MPFYEFDVTSPANTPQTAPTEVKAPLIKGVITHVHVQIPAGVQGLTGAQIWRANSQLWPTNPPGYIKGDNAIIIWEEDYELEDEPLTLRLLVWNRDDFFPHTITFRFALTPLARAQEIRAGPGLLKRMGKSLGIGA